MPARIIPSLRYSDPRKAIEWLCTVLSFEEHLVVPGPDNSIIHAQLKHGRDMIMLGSDHDNEYGRLVKIPSQIDNYNTMTIYLIVDGIDEHYLRIKDSGVRILLDLEEQEYGGKSYICVDPEGHIWTFGDYDPWA